LNFANVERGHFIRQGFGREAGWLRTSSISNNPELNPLGIGGSAGLGVPDNQVSQHATIDEVVMAS
jgi:hypothetical protein